jgi:heat shock protein HslJ
MHRIVAASALGLILAGCSLLPAAMDIALDGEWQLQAGTSQGQPLPIVPGTRISLRVKGLEIGGSGACNIYGGTLQVDGTTIRITALSMTEMACRDDIMASEAAYLAVLPTVTGATRTGRALILTGPQVELRFANVPPVADAGLLGRLWVLESLINGGVASSTVGPAATLQLNVDGTLSGSTGCRSLSGAYSISGSEAQVTLQPMDMIGCVEPLGSQDGHVLAVISNGFSFVVDGNSLTLTAGGKGLVYRVASSS